MTLDQKDYVGISEIAAHTKRSKQAVANWRSRNPDFPKPVLNLKAGPVFKLNEITDWLDKKGLPLTPVNPTEKSQTAKKRAGQHNQQNKYKIPTKTA